MTTKREYVYRPVVHLALGICRALGFRFDLRGVDNIPAGGGAVLAANHVSYFDFVFVGFAAHHRSRLVRFLAKRSVFEHWPLGPLMRGMGHISVDRSAGADAYRHAIAALRAGELVGVFPEATISRSFVPRQLKAGAARMAIEAGVPLIPVVTWGGHRVWTAGRRPRFQRRVPITIVVDAPLAVSGASISDATEQLAERLDALVRRVVDDYPDRALGAGAWWMPARAGGGAPTVAEAAAPEEAAISADGRDRPAP